MKRDEYLLSHPQKRVWFTEQLYPGTPMHNIGGYLKVHAAVAATVLKAAIERTIERTPALRTRVCNSEDGPRQYIIEHSDEVIPVVDFSDSGEEAFSSWVAQVMKTPVELEDNILFHAAVFSLPDKTGGFLLKMHHIISDGWSFGLLGKRIMEEYVALLGGKVAEQDIEASYHADYLPREKEYLKSERFLKDRLFWREKFVTANEYFLLNNSGVLEGRRISYELAPALSEALNKLSALHRISPNTIFVAAMALYLHKSTGLEDIVLGTPVANRSGRKEKAIVGMFTSSMPLRIQVEKEDELAVFLKKVNSNILDCFFHQKYPYEFILQDSNLTGSGASGLFNLCVNFYNARMEGEAGGLEYSCHEIHPGHQYYPLQMVVHQQGGSGSFETAFDYRPAEYDEFQINNIFNCINHLLRAFAEKPGQKIEELALLPQETVDRLIYGFNDRQASYPEDMCIHGLIERQVQQTPGRAALDFDGLKLTYGEMNCRANQLARKLSALGVAPGKTAAVMTRHSIETVVAILAVLKAGGAYVPIDPSYPRERIRFILEDSGAVLLLVNYSVEDTAEYKCQICDLRAGSLYTGDDSNPGIPVSPGELAYIIYTSGSTGKPKGVMVEHRGLVNYIWWAKKSYVKSIEDSFALYSSLAFDLTVTSVFTPLAGGNCLYIYPDDGDKFVLYRIFEDNRTSIVKLTPAHLSLLRGGNYTGSAVKSLIVGGEDLKAELADDIYKCFGGKVDIYNEYGPTETVVGCMIHRYDPAESGYTSVPIGVPADNVQIYLLDQGLHPVMEGLPGEIYIAGDGVARGYLGREDLTGERFIENPFIQGGRMYKTGDMARFAREGIIQYMGRKDFQVKIKGFRIETGEIERKILDYGNVAEAVVIDRVNPTGEKYLCAYLVVKKPVDILRLKRFLGSYLPEYMIPQSFVEMESLPLTGNGKLDRNRLPYPETGARTSQAEYVPPENQVQERVAAIFQEILGIEKIGLEDDFFEMGGDSIKAIQISSKLLGMGIRVKARDVMSRGTIQKILQNAGTGQVEAEYHGGAARDGTDLSPEFKGTPVLKWFVQQKLPHANYYNQSVLFSINPDIRDEWIDEALGVVLEQHAALSLAYDEQKELFSYGTRAEAAGFKIPRLDLSEFPEDLRQSELKAACVKLKSNMEIKEGRLVNACIFKLGRLERRLFVTIHHMGVDGVSWRIITEDMVNVLSCKSRGVQYLPPPGSTGYHRWARALERYAQSRALLYRQYWEDTVRAACAGSEHIRNHARRLLQPGQTGCRVLEGPQYNELYIPEINNSYKYGFRTEEILITALVETLAPISENHQMVIELEGHGRADIDDNIDLGRTVGWFTSIYPVKFLISEGNHLSRLRQVREVLQQVPHNGLSFGALKYGLGHFKEYDSGQQIRFNYLGEFEKEFGNGLLTIAQEYTGWDVSPHNGLNCVLEINIMSVAGRLKLSFANNEEVLGLEAAQRLMADYAKNLEGLLLGLKESVAEGLSPGAGQVREEAACTREQQEIKTTAQLSEEDLDQLFS